MRFLSHKLVYTLLFFLVVFLLPQASTAATDGDCFCKSLDANGIYTNEKFYPQLDANLCKNAQVADGKPTVCRWQPKSNFCCCTTEANGKISECTVANNYSEYQICNAAVYAAGTTKVSFWDQGTCQCNNNNAVYPIVTVAKGLFNNLDCKAGLLPPSTRTIITNAIQAVPERKYNCIDANADTPQIHNCHFSDNGTCMCTVTTESKVTVNANQNYQNCRYTDGGTACLCEDRSNPGTMKLNEFGCKLQIGCEWKPAYQRTAQGYVVKVDDNQKCVSYINASKSVTPEAAKAANAKLLAEANTHFNPGKFSNVTDLIGVAIKILMSFIGSIALVLYIYSGILWITAMGNSEKTEQAKSMIQWTTLGLIAMLASYLIVTQLFSIVGVGV